MVIDMIGLDRGSGGKETHELIEQITSLMRNRGDWKGTDDDSSYMKLGDKYLVFTTDSFVVDPIFFPGGDIGKLAICGTINDLAVMGAKPLGISLGLIIEEGFSDDDLLKIITSIDSVSQSSDVPIATGDTKVMEKGKLDKIVINTSGVGITDRIITDSGLRPGDRIITNGTLGDHGGALLAKRFGYDSEFVSDCAPVISNAEKISAIATSMKDPTRGGAAGALNEMADKSKVKIVIDEKRYPVLSGVRAISDLLGIDYYDMPSEGRIIAGIEGDIPEGFIDIGRVEEGCGVFIDMGLSKRKLSMPFGRMIPRIC